MGETEQVENTNIWNAVERMQKSSGLQRKVHLVCRKGRREILTEVDVHEYLGWLVGGTLVAINSILAWTWWILRTT